jgi:hypothetical protein
VVLKPASLTPLTALRFAELTQEAGLPEGVFNVVTGPGGKVGMALVRHPGVDKVAFTGSTDVGKGIMREAAGSLKRVSLELGGKSPNVVFADADLEAALRGALTGIFYNKGEVCAAGSRLLVEERVHDEFVGKLVDRVKGLKVGDPMDKATRMGPVVSAQQLDIVLGYVEAGRREGATLAAGGERVRVGDGRGYFVQPTVFTGVSNGMRIAREEIFGPVLSVSRTPTTPWRRATRPSTASQPRCGRATSAGRSGSRGRSGPAPSGSTPTTSTTPRSPLGASRNPASGGSSARRAWTSTPRSRASGWISRRVVSLAQTGGRTQRCSRAW